MTTRSTGRVIPRLDFPASVLVLIAAAAPISAQQVNYARAEQLLTWNSDRLVSGDQVNPQWLKDGNRFCRSVFGVEQQHVRFVFTDEAGLVAPGDQARVVCQTLLRGAFSRQPAECIGEIEAHLPRDKVKLMLSESGV